MSDEAAQPVEGQGAEPQEGNSLYAQFLEDVPPEIHDRVIPALKAQDAEFTKRFQSRSEQMKPFEELGIFDMEPEHLGQYLSLDEAMANAQQGDAEAREAVYGWWDQIGDTLGFYDAGDEGADDDDDDDGDFDLFDMNKGDLQKAIRAQVEQALAPVTQQLQARSQQEAEAQELAAVNEQIDQWVNDLKSEHPSVFGGEDGDEVMDEVLELAGMFTDAENPIQAGFEKYQSLVGKGESALFEKKSNQPMTPERSGTPDTSVPTPTMENARELALERIRKANQMA